MRLDRTYVLAGLLAAGLLITGCSVLGASSASRPPVESCGVGFAGTTFLFRQTGPHARAHCAANVKRSKPLGAYWSTQTGAGLVLVCQVRYKDKDHILDQVYAASRDDFFAQTDCAVLASEVKKGKAVAIPVHQH